MSIGTGTKRNVKKTVLAIGFISIIVLTGGAVLWQQRTIGSLSRQGWGQGARPGDGPRRTAEPPARAVENENRLRRALGISVVGTLVLMGLSLTAMTVWAWWVRRFLRRRNREMVYIRQKAEAAGVAKSRFLANMSHEIRTPMTAVIGYADMLEDQNLTEEERSEYISAIRSSARHLMGLINDILDLSKIEADKLVLEVRPTSLADLVAQVLSMMRVSASQRNISLRGEFPTPLPKSILTDGHRLRQVLVNLVSNAIKFADTRGVRIVTSFLPAWREGQSAVQIDVIDWGMGISQTVLHRLGEAFVQAEAQTTRKFGGTGLGLAICRRLVDLMGGEFRIASKIGEGSTFTILLPTGSLEGVDMLESPAEAVENRSSTPEEKNNPSTSCLRGMRVLLAEDGEINRKLICTLLSQAGADVTLAENGRIAAEKALAEPFDLVLMDVQMPVMDGLEATGTLRESGFDKPILALTANALSGDRDMCLQAGCTDYLSKPVHRTTLLQAVARYVQTDPPEPPAAKPTPQENGASMIRSQFEKDSDLMNIAEEFIDDLPETLTAMRRFLDDQDFGAIARLAHQIKGAGGGCGYPCLTQAALVLEKSAQQKDVEVTRLALAEMDQLTLAIAAGLRERNLTP